MMLSVSRSVRQYRTSLRIKHLYYSPLNVRCRYGNQAQTNHPDFSDTKIAFKSKTNPELLRAYCVYKLFSYPSIVDNSEKILKHLRRYLGTSLFHRLMKGTVYGQFVAGEDLDTLRPIMRRLRSQGIRSILDYAVEDDISESNEVSMEIRQKTPSNPKAYNPADPDLYPQYSSSTTSSKAVVRASARTYFYKDEHKCDENMENFIKCINAAADASEGEDSFAAIKITGLGRTEFLLRLSELLSGAENVFKSLADGPSLTEGVINRDSFHNGLENMNIQMPFSKADSLFQELDLNNSGTLNIFEWLHNFQPSSELYQILSSNKLSKDHPLLPVLSDNENDQMESVLRRATQLADCASDRGVRLMVDAEQSYYQPAIRHITVNYLMPKYNFVKPIIYNTQQCYMKSSKSSISLDLSAVATTGFHYGVKLVRGAYMEQERELSIKKDYEDPIFKTKQDTDNNYHDILEDLLHRVANNDKVNIMVATHNEDTVKYALSKMSELGVPRDSSSVVFGQLLGMCDHVTLSLGSSGYLSYKYMPYGPVDEALPYLQRRANENKGMLKGAVRERTLLEKELKRRLCG